MDDVPESSLLIPRSESKPRAVGQKRASVEIVENSELGHKRVKMRDLGSLLRSERIDTHYPNYWKNKEESINHLHSKEGEITRVTKETITINSNVSQPQIMVNGGRLDLNTKISTVDDGPNSNLPKPRGIGFDLNAEDVSSSVSNYSSNPCKSREFSEHTSSCGEHKDPMLIWKEMKQNGFLSSSSHGGVPIPRPRGRKPKNDNNGMKKKMEIAKKEQVDRFAKIAAPSGLLNGLNPGIINHVRNSKQVHSIIEALVRSEKHENRHVGNKSIKQTKIGIHEGRGEDSKNGLKLSSCTTLTSENTSSLCNEESVNLTSETSLSVKAADVASLWLELLHQDIKGRLAALRRSKRRVRSVTQIELPNLMSKEFSSYQENTDPYATETGSVNVSVDMHRARWSALFDQMDKALVEEEKQLVSWLDQVKEMLQHCERGLFQYGTTNGLQHVQKSESDYRLQKSDKSDGELAVRAAAASIYSTCNFLQSMENLPCF